MKKAFVTGITGQDGSYLAELLLKKDYEVHGIIRRSSTFSTSRIDHIYQDPHESGRRLFLYYGDLTDAESVRKLLYRVQPDEVYNLGAQSHVKVSFDIPEYTAETVALGTLRILEAIRDFQEQFGKKIKFYQAGSSEMFGTAAPPQSEQSPFLPRSPYGCAKVFAYHLTNNYRDAYGIFAVNGILFNHESPRRGETFVTRKVTRGIARIKAGLDKKIYLGNLAARRDWGYAPEYVEAMWLMLQQPKPENYVIGTGTSHSVEELVKLAFHHAGINNWRDYIEIDPKYYRPTDVESLVADPSKAAKKLGWKAKTSFEELIRTMLEHDLKTYHLT